MSHIKNYSQETGKGLEYYSSKYENFIVLGGFNAQMSNPLMSKFLYQRQVVRERIIRNFYP